MAPNVSTPPLTVLTAENMSVVAGRAFRAAPDFASDNFQEDIHEVSAAP